MLASVEAIIARHAGPDISPEEALGASPGGPEALAETIDFLRSPRALEMIAANPYWPKWDSPWWRIRLLDELGLASRIPRETARRLAEAVDSKCLRHFPFKIEDIPAGVDPQRGIPCHCQLGTMAQTLAAAGIAIGNGAGDALGWVLPWCLRYQLEDGGLNCDEAAYTRAVPRSSFLSTVCAAEGVLRAPRRPHTPEERAFLSRATGYLRARKLARSLSKSALAVPDWLLPCFPRFYEYDVLRGLTFLAEWAAKMGETLREEEIAETIEGLDRHFSSPDPTAPRRWFANARTVRQDESGSWTIRETAKRFPLLEVASGTAVAGAVLGAEWRRTLAVLARH